MQQLDLLRSRPAAEVVDLDIGRRAIAAVEGAVLADIFDQFEGLQRSPQWKVHFNDVLSGQLVPPDEGDQARAKQLELWLAARALGAGARVQLSNPDLLFEDEHGTFVVEAKRVLSASGLQRNIEKAVDQILQSAHPGIIALDVSRLLNLDHAVLPVTDLADGHRELTAQVAHLARHGDFAKWVQARDPQRRVRAMFAVIFTGFMNVDTGAITGVRKMIADAVHEGPTDGRVLFERLVGMPVRTGP